MKKDRTRWVKTNSPLHKRLETAEFIGHSRGIRELAQMLAEECAIDEDYIIWLLEEKLEHKNKKL